MLRSAALALAFVSYFACSASADVLVVGGTVGSYPGIQEAVDAAHDGDAILVLAGTYDEVFLHDKELAIVADEGATVVVLGAIQIDGLSPTKTVSLAGLRVYGRSTPYHTPALYLSDDLGSVRAEDCSFTGGARPADAPLVAVAAAYVFGNSSGAAFTHCSFTGGDAGSCDWCDGLMGGAGIYVAPGAQATQSRVALYDCDVRGGAGSTSVADTTGGAGGQAIVLGNEGFLHASNSTLVGGKGGVVCDVLPSSGGRGGDGLFLFGGSGAWNLETTITPGLPGGPSTGCDVAQGPPGRTIVGSGAYFEFGTPSLDLQVDRVVREGHDALVRVRGSPGTIVDLVFADATAFAPIPAWHGVRLTRKSPGLHAAMYLGEIPASGVITEGITTGDLPPGIAGETFFLQVRGRGVGGLVLGGFSALTVVDSAY